MQLSLLPRAAIRALCLLAATTLAGGCLVRADAGREPFDESSLDKHGGKPHRLVVGKAERHQVVGQLIRLAKQRELTLVKQRCDRHSCELAFRGKPVDRRVFRGTTSQVLSYYSRYFVSLRVKGSDLVITAVGAPVLGGVMACPRYLARTVNCELHKAQRPAGGSRVEAVRSQWGYDISGANEAETLDGLLAELGNPAAPQPAAGGSVIARARRGSVVAVFDIEDQTGSVKRATLGQLTEYLAAKVTQYAGYQVVPREQLRSRLSAQKRHSYRHCYSQSCQIELGKAMAAEKSLATKLLRVGRHCALTSMLFDLRTETTERAASAKTACDEDALLGGIERLAKQLAGS